VAVLAAVAAADRIAEVLALPLQPATPTRGRKNLRADEQRLEQESPEHEVREDKTGVRRHENSYRTFDGSDLARPLFRGTWLDWEA